MAMVAAAPLASPSPAAAASPTRDPDLPNRPRDIADLFLVDSYKRTDKAGNVTFATDWLCRPDPKPTDPKHCRGDSPTALTNLNDALRAGRGKPELLRVGKARDDCVNGALPPACATGVPPRRACDKDRPHGDPFCALTDLKAKAIKLGVIVGARDKEAGDQSEEAGRPIQDIAWQACQIHAEDRDSYRKGDGRGSSGFYDFLFLDQAHKLGGDLKRAVKYINEGKVLKPGGDPSQPGDWKKGRHCGQGWDVITNDNGVNGADLAPQAWGHAKRYDVARRPGTLLKAANNGPILTDHDRDFLRSVKALRPPHGLTTGAVLRAEVTDQTSRLAHLSAPQQCRVLGRWAAAQQDQDTPFASLFPLYNHGLDREGTAPYDSFFEGTSKRQLELMVNPGRGDDPRACRR